MTNETTDEPEAILADDMRFKEKLGLGEDTYQAMRKAKIVERTVAMAGAASIGALIASSPLVATTFFPSTGLLAALGFGVAATTPIGWVLAAGALTGGAYYGGRRMIDAMRRKRTFQIPKYINTALDLLADQLLGLMLPLSLWIARYDDKQVSGEEKKSIRSYYVDEWGYNAAFVDRAIEELAGKVGTEASTKSTTRELAESLSEYCAANKDCNTEHIKELLVGHLNDLVEVERSPEYRERKSRAAREFESALAGHPLPFLPLKSLPKWMRSEC